MKDDEIKIQFWKVVESFQEPAVYAAFKSVEEKIPLGLMLSTIDQADGSNGKIKSTLGVAERLKLNVEIISSGSGNVINFTMLPIQILILQEWKSSFEELAATLQSSVRLGLASEAESAAVELVLRRLNELIAIFSSEELDAVEFLRNTFGHFYADSYYLSWDDNKKKLTSLRGGKNRRELKASIAKTLEFTDNDIKAWALAVAGEVLIGTVQLYEATLAWSKIAKMA
jgi:hypothetical protein